MGGEFTLGSASYFVLPVGKLLYSYKGVINFISLNASVSFAKNDDLLFRQPLYFQGALTSFIVNEIKLMRTLKTRHGEETCEKLELFIYNQRRQMKDIARAIYSMQSSPAEGPSCLQTIRGRRNETGRWEGDVFLSDVATVTFSVLLLSDSN